VRAWAFEPKLKLLDVLKEQLTFESTLRALLLEEDDANTVLALPKVELRLPQLPILERLRAMTHALHTGRPTTGPIPGDWSGIVTKFADQEAGTYVMRFGRRSVWKIGHTQDLASRLAEINQHVRHEELGERWALVRHQHWESSIEAYEMEQRVLGALGPYRTEGERIRCSDVELEIAWTRCLT
jgi:predicted GIY-YIG superfamily endonuclease